jgi:hypothetical protein
MRRYLGGEKGTLVEDWIGGGDFKDLEEDKQNVDAIVALHPVTLALVHKTGSRS